MPRPAWRAALAAAGVALLVTSCREQALGPDLAPAPDTAPDPEVVLMDSSTMLASVRQRPRGLFLAPVATDSLLLVVPTDSVWVTLESRDCAASSNVVSLLSPESELLRSTMCQATVDTTWKFTGPYTAGSAVRLQFTSGAGNGNTDGRVQIAGHFPNWTLSFEDYTDSDFNDFVLGVQAFVNDTLFYLVLEADQTELHPWIQSFEQAADNGTIDQALRVGDTTSVTVRAMIGNVSIDSLPVTVTAEFLPRTGGHHHLDDRLLFSEAPAVPQGTAAGRPVTGYFKHGSNRVAELTDTTDLSGELSFAFVAGFLSGDVEVIATTEYDATTHADTLGFRIRVPGLADLEATTTVDDDAYLIGQTIVQSSSPPDTVHARDSIWYVTPTFGDRLEELAAAMVRDSATTTYYLQMNDASLPWGGTFSVSPDTTTNQPVDVPYDRGHRTHALGIDIDIGWCQVPFTGEDGQIHRISGSNCAAQGGVGVIFRDLQEAAMSRGLLLLREGTPRHYHLRLAVEP